jgi:hypothetical protein
MLLFTVVALVLSGCLEINDAVVYCSRVEIDYSPGYSYDGPYLLRAYRTSDNQPISDAVEVVGDVPGSVTLDFYEEQEEGTSIYLVSQGQTDSESYTDYDVDCSKNGTRATTWFEPGDDRINRQAYAYASVYCQDAEQRVAIYGIHSAGVGDPGRNDGSGFPAIFVPYAELPPVPTDGNVLIAEYANIAFYRLTTGEYQINAGPDFEGKEYVLVWDGCPSSYIQAYILQNGVLTQTEVYPRAE